MPTLNNNENSGQTVQDDAGSSMNDSRTVVCFDTPLTRRRSYRVPVKGEVYFIRGGDAIKIGYSLNPESRVRELQTGCPDELSIVASMVGDHRTEDDLHTRFAELKIRGEWFRADPALLDFIAQHAVKYEKRPAPIITLPPPRPPKMGPSLEGRVAIRHLHKMRDVHGADTPIGHCCSNLAEQIGNQPDYVRPEWAADERQTLPWMMKRTAARLAALRAAMN